MRRLKEVFRVYAHPVFMVERNYFNSLIACKFAIVQSSSSKTL